MKKKFRQKKSLREIETKKNYNGEASPYWEFMEKKAQKHQTYEGSPTEDSLANPDVLSEDDHLYHRPLSEDGEFKFNFIREMMKELSPQQQTVLQLCGFDGLTLKEAAKEMGLKIPTVQVFLDRARELIQKRYKEALKNEEK